jgi:hypothetical protein
VHISNFQIKKTPAIYIVEVWRSSINFKIRKQCTAFLTDGVLKSCRGCLMGRLGNIAGKVAVKVFLRAGQEKIG